MEYIIMLIAHVLKTAAYFAAVGFPEIPLEQFPAAAEAFVFNIIKLAEIYTSMI